MDLDLILGKVRSMLLVRALRLLFFRLLGWDLPFFGIVFFVGVCAVTGSSTSSPKPAEWEMVLDLPDDHLAPESLRSHIKEQLRFLFNIGRKKTLSDSMFEEFISPLALDQASVGFSKSLLDRVSRLQLIHYNRGNHIPFPFGTKTEKERLYSIIWEYAKKLGDE